MNDSVSLAPDVVLTRTTDLVGGEMDGETVLMSIKAGKYYGMEAVGTRIWQLLETPRSGAQICDELVKEFEVSRADCERDVVVFLKDLVAEGLAKPLGQ